MTETAVLDDEPGDDDALPDFDTTDPADIPDDQGDAGAPEPDDG
jgi:hypothetical protein